MLFYEFLKLYNSLAAERIRLTKLVKKHEPRYLYTRKRGGKTYYFMRKQMNGRMRASAVTQDEYYRYAIENYRYKRAADELEEIEKLIKTQDNRAKEYARKLDRYNNELAKIAKVQPPSKPSNYRRENLRYQTLRGEKVRSKSEAIIADTLYKHGICYHYEPEFAGWDVLPDFYISDSIYGRSIIWEHFGLTDDPDYEQKCYRKLVYYAEKGFVLGDNLIVTEESFDSSVAESVVLRFFNLQSSAA